MKRLLLSTAMAFSGIAMTAQTYPASGYYRVQNVESGQYITITDTEGKLNYTASDADLGALRTWGNFNSDHVVSNPASVIYVDRQGTTDAYDLQSQGTGAYAIVQHYLRVKPFSDGTYGAFASMSGITKYIYEYLSDYSDEYREIGVTSFNATKKNQRWNILPISSNNDNNYFGIKPTVQVGSDWYKTFYADFNFNFASSGMSAYFVSKVDETKGLVVYEPINETVAKGTPIIVKCSSDQPSNNRLDIVTTKARAIAGNKLTGVYFCTTLVGTDTKAMSASHVNCVEYDENTMRVLGITSDGSLGFIKAPESALVVATGKYKKQQMTFKCIPANTAYIKVSTGAPAELKLVSSEEYGQSKAVTITARSYSRAYGDANPTFEYDATGSFTGQPELSCEATATSPVGTYPITVSKGTISDAIVTTVAGTLTITPAPLTATAQAASREYGDANPDLKFTYSGWKNGETEEVLTTKPTVSTTATTASPAGEYDITVNGGAAKNYTFTYIPAKLTINKAPLKVKADDKSRMEGMDNPELTVTYTGFKNGETANVLDQQPTVATTATKTSAPGAYPITVSGGSAKNYTLSYENGTLTITPGALQLKAKSYTRVYGDENPAFEFEQSGSATLKGTPAITCAATKESPVGTYDIVITKGTVENGNVTYVNGTLTITKAPLKVKADDKTRVEGMDNPELTVTYTGFKNNETASVLEEQPTVTTTASMDSKPGTYPITVSGGSAKNYTLSYEDGKLTVTEGTLQLTAKSYTREYGEENPEFKFEQSGTTTLKGTPAITCAATKESPVGTYDIIITKGTVENGNVTYVNGTLTITKAPLKVKADDKTRMEGMENPELTVTYTGFKNNETASVLEEQPTVTTTATMDSKPGTYPITVSGGSAKNYALSYEDGKLTVTEGTLQLTAKSYTREYGEENPEFKFEQSGTATLKGTPAITCAATKESPVGTYDIVITKGTVENGNVTYVNGTLTITKAPLKVKADDKTRMEGTDNPELTVTYTGFKNNETASVLEEQPTVTTTATMDSKPGTYPITVSGGSAKNYTLSYEDGTLTVTEGTLQLTAKSYTREYGEENPEFKFEQTGTATLKGTPAITCAATKDSPVGTYDIVITKGTVENGNVTYVNGTLTITKAPLKVKADDKTRMEGMENPELTVTYTGFKNGETASVLDEQPTVTTTATKESTPGTYPITVSGGSAKNYTLSYEDGTLTVTEGTLQLTAKSYTREYGEENPEFKFEQTGTATLKGTPAITCAATKDSPVGTYDIVIAQGTVENGNVTYVNGTLTITKAPLKVKADDKTRMEGTDNPELTVTYTGFKNNETASVLDEQPTVITTATKESIPGTYPITVSGGSAKNYTLSYENGTLTVTPGTLQLTAKNYTREYGEENPFFEFEQTGTATLRGTPDITCAATKESPVGTYDIIIAQGTVTNENVTYANGTLTITKAPLKVKADNKSRLEGMDNPELTITYTGFKNGENSNVLDEQPTISTTATKDSAPGTYPITVSGGSSKNYTLTYEDGTLTITPGTLMLTAKSYTREYGEENPEFEFEQTGTATLRGTPTVICAATTKSPVGIYPIVILQGTVENENVAYVDGTLTITEAPLNVKADDKTRMEGTDNPELTVTYTGFKNNETSAVLSELPTVTTTATKDSSPGTYPIIVSGGSAENYKLNYEKGTLTITPGTLMLTAKSYSREYGEENPVFEFEQSGTATLRGVPAITCAATKESAVGTYDIVIAKGTVENENVTYVKGTLTITKAPLKVKADDKSRLEGTDNPEFTLTYIGFKNNDDTRSLDELPTVSTTATKDSTPGTYPITVSGGKAKNYTLSYENGTLTVTPGTLMLTAKSYTREYGEENPVFEFEQSGTATLRGVPAITCAATKESAVGTYDIVIAKGTVENENVTYVKGTLTITKAPLKVKADDKSRLEGTDNPEFTLTYIGFKNNDDTRSLDELPTVSTTATKDSTPGTYPITVSGGKAKNYTLSYENGTLTVTPGTLMLTAKSYTREYGEENPAFEFEQTGTATLRGTPAITCAATKDSPVGTYDIVIAKGTVENENVTYVKGTLTITKAPLTVTANDATREKGKPNPEFTLTYSGWKNGENETVLNEKPVAVTEADEQSEVGDYEITVSGGSAQNYEFKYVSGKLTVIPAAPLLIVVEDNENGNEETLMLNEEEGTAEFISVAAQNQGDSVDKVEIPETVTYNGKIFTVTKIAEGTFENMTTLYTVIIPKSIVEIKPNAFAGCTGLTKLFVDIENPISLLGNAARDMDEATDADDDDPVFSGVDKEVCVLYVPIGSKEKYVKAPVWNTFKHIVEIDIQGVDEVTYNTGATFSIYSISGNKVRSQATSLKGLPTGIYIVNGKKIMVK